MDVRFRKLSLGSYAVEWFGTPIGSVHKDPLGAGWQPWTLDNKSGPYFATRKEAAEYLRRQWDGTPTT